MPNEGVWKDRYCIGMPQIDSQHRQLLLTTEGLLQAVRQQGADGKKNYKDTVAYLKNYVVVHFGSEELFMQQMEYSRFAQHHALHVAFTEQLHEKELGLIRCDYGEEAVREMASMVTKWWIYHIMKEDRHIGAEAHEKGVLP